MSHVLRQALCRANGLVGCASKAYTAAAAAGHLEPLALTSLLGFRGFKQQSWAAQSAAAAPSQQEQLLAAGVAAVPPAPWTPTRDLKKRKILPKRMQYLLSTLEAERENALAAELQRPEFGPGDVIELKLSVPENKRRVSVFKGICIARRNRSVRTSFTLRNIYGASGGIERTFPLYSPHITEMKVLSRRKVRRAKLYYLRERTAKEYRT